jgi:hypothetical protein
MESQLKVFIFQGKHDTAVIIACNSTEASEILLSWIAESEDDYYLAMTMPCNEGANRVCSTYLKGDFIDRK